MGWALLTSSQLLLSSSLGGRLLLSPPLPSSSRTSPPGQTLIIWLRPGASNYSFDNPQTPGETALSFVSPFPIQDTTQVGAQLPISTPKNDPWRKFSVQRCLKAYNNKAGLYPPAPLCRAPANPTVLSISARSGGVPARINRRSRNWKNCFCFKKQPL